MDQDVTKILSKSGGSNLTQVVKATARVKRSTQVFRSILNDSIYVRNSVLDFSIEVAIIADRGEGHYGQWNLRYATRRVDRLLRIGSGFSRIG